MGMAENKNMFFRIVNGNGFNFHGILPGSEVNFVYLSGCVNIRILPHVLHKKKAKQAPLDICHNHVRYAIVLCSTLPHAPPLVVPRARPEICGGLFA